MKAFILAAPAGADAAANAAANATAALAPVRGRALIVWHIQNLVRAGMTEILIGASAPALPALQAHLQDGSAFGAQLAWVDTGAATEMGGAIGAALPLLGDEPFVALPATIFCPHFDFGEAVGTLEERDAIGIPYPPDQRDIGWLYLVDNPDGASGDFSVLLYALGCDGTPRYTCSGIGVYRPEMFGEAAGGADLMTILRHHAQRGRLGGEIYIGPWSQAETAAQLAFLNAPARAPKRTLDA